MLRLILSLQMACCAPQETAARSFVNHESVHTAAHVMVPAWATFSAYATFKSLGASGRTAAAGATAVSAAAVFGKEYLLDSRASGKDLLLGAAGTGAGIWLSKRLFRSRAAGKPVPAGVPASGETKTPDRPKD